MYLRRHPLCELCEQEGRITPATIVHHKQPIKHGGHALDMENLMSVCRECHIRLHTGKECTP
nr:HNH endonuclease signature motif containing protein [Desulfovirgula thermocuniculi]